MIRIILAYFLLFSSALDAQEHIPVFPELEGDQLMERLVSEFKPTVVLNYSQARDTMFRLIDSTNDSLTCVYSGYTIYLDPNQDPTQAAFMDGNSNGINTEHTYPQSLGAELGNARSDMHHLFPTRSIVNSARGNKIFEDIDDDQTDVWYYLNTNQSTIPSLDNIDLFSETDADGFEPPEAHKGDVARAMFYFYTMYQDFADGADATYFDSQKETLCQWHFDDPVDEKEWNRTLKIAEYQDGKANPFIYDCGLASRLYCLTEFCQPTSTTDVLTKQEIRLVPNPAYLSTTILLENFNGKCDVLLYNLEGKLVKQASLAGHDSAYELDLSYLNSGIYYVKVISSEWMSCEVLVVR